jgi:hypothetical protein
MTMIDPVTRLDPEVQRMTAQAVADLAYSLRGECAAVRMARSEGIEPRDRPELRELEKAGEVYRKAHEDCCAKAAGARAGVKVKPRQVKSAPNTPESVTPSDPLRLEIAAQLAFPDGSMTTSGLRNEINKGRLVAENIAGKMYTTLANIEDMRAACVVQRDPSSTSAKPSAKAISDVGSSWTATPTASAGKSAQAHLNATAQLLKKSTPLTSPKSTPRASAQVTRLKS